MIKNLFGYEVLLSCGMKMEIEYIGKKKFSKINLQKEKFIKLV